MATGGDQRGAGKRAEREGAGVLSGIAARGTCAPMVEPALEEGVGLVERVGDEVEQRQPPGAEAALDHHEAHLRDGREGERAFHAGLGEHDDGAEDRGQRADHREQMQRAGRGGEDRGEPQDQEAARVDDAGVHEGGDRRGRVHRVRQPAVEGKLRGLQHRAEGQQKGGGRQARLVSAADRGDEFVDAPGAVPAVEQDRGDQQRELGEAAEDEFFPRREDRTHAIRMMQQQAVEAQAGRNPGAEQEQQVVGNDQREDRDQRERHPREEARALRIALEVAGGEAQDDRSQEGDEHGHRDGEGVEADETGFGQRGSGRLGTCIGRKMTKICILGNDMVFIIAVNF